MFVPRKAQMANVCSLVEPSDPTPLSVVQVEYAKQVDYLLSAVTVPGLTPEQLTIFQTSNRPYAFVCRFPGCTSISAGFPNHGLRIQHELIHKPALFCTHPGCKYSLPFASPQNLRKHIGDFHDSRSRLVAKSIRRRKATLLWERSVHSPRPSPLGSLDVQSQVQSQTTGPPEASQPTRPALGLHHFVQHYRHQLQKGKIPNGWQQGTPPEERGQLALQFFLLSRLLNPEIAEVEAMRATLQFETEVSYGCMKCM
jgi:hypothetical protein